MLSELIFFVLKRDRVAHEDALAATGTPSKVHYHPNSSSCLPPCHRPCVSRKDRQKLMREEEVLGEIFNTLKVSPSQPVSQISQCFHVLLNAWLTQAPFSDAACAGCSGTLITDMVQLHEPRHAWLKEVCRLCYRLIRHLATDYRKNQEVFCLSQRLTSGHCKVFLVHAVADWIRPAGGGGHDAPR